MQNKDFMTFGLFKFKKNLIQFGIQLFWKLQHCDYQIDSHQEQINTFSVHFFDQKFISVRYLLTVIDQDSYLVCELLDKDYQVIGYVNSSCDIDYQARYSHLFVNKAHQLKNHQPQKDVNQLFMLNSVKDFYQQVGHDTLDWILKLHLNEFELQMTNQNCLLKCQLNKDYQVLIEQINSDFWCRFYYQDQPLFSFLVDHDHHQTIAHKFNQLKH